MTFITILWRHLTDAPARVMNPVARQQVRLLSGLILVLIPLALMAAITHAQVVPDFWPVSRIIFGALLVLALAYGIARTGYFNAAAVLTIAVAAATCFMVMWLRPGELLAYFYLNISIVLAALLFGTIGIWVTLTINLLATTLVLPAVGVTLPGGDPASVILLAIVAGLLFVSIRQRDALERTRSSELAASAARFRALFHASPVAMVLNRRADGRFIDTNPIFEQWSGWPRADVIGQTTTELGFLTPTQREHLLQQLGCNGSVHDQMLTTRVRSGERRDILFSVVPLSLDGEECLLGTMMDITAQQHAEAKMRKLSSAIEQTADSVVITDRNGVIEYVNPAFEKYTGFTAAEAIGQTPRLVKSDKQNAAFYQQMWQIILKGQVFSDVLINRRKDGSYYYEEKTISPLKDVSGNITHFISTGKDVSERMQAQERLAFMAQHDALTALPNRALLLDRLKQSITRARRHDWLVALLFVDLDRFKTINDTLGHEIGDKLLQQLSERFARSVREGDTVARFGGDEFVIVLTDVGSDKDISIVAQKVLDALKAPFTIEGQSFYITASIGISLFPNDGEDSTTLLKHADIAMYRAKELGKNTYHYYSSDMSARAFERLSLETNLRHALERNEFVLHYQPQFDVATGKIFGVEALLRWQHPDLGLVSPAEFIALLEETGLIVPTGEWVLYEAARQFNLWHTAGHQQLRLAVNLSPRQMQSAGLVATVQRVLGNVPAATGWLELEITEGLLVQHAPTLLETFAALRNLGVRLAIDDFGTGYSSLSYLRRLPIDTLKIDRSFVHDVPADADDSAITTTIIAMAQTLRLEVIAEGVENTAQRAFLNSFGCQRMQGNLFARPRPADEITQLLAGADLPS